MVRILAPKLPNAHKKINLPQQSQELANSHAHNFIDGVVYILC
jgi:hypothetical protein